MMDLRVMDLGALLLSRGRLKLWADVRPARGQTEVRVHIVTKEHVPPNCTLHWGLCAQPQSGWEQPPRSIWPAQTRAHGDHAVQTPLTPEGDGAGLHILLPTDLPYRGLSFVLYWPDQGRWTRAEGHDFSLELPTSAAMRRAPLQQLQQQLDNSGTSQQDAFLQSYELGKGLQLAAAIIENEDRFCVTLLCNARGPLLLHWGIARRTRGHWRQPPEALRPPGTRLPDDKAAQTPFRPDEGYQRLELLFARQQAPAGLWVVLHQPQGGHWLKPRKGDIFLPLAPPRPATGPLQAPALAAVVDQIISQETTRGSWTLMHRFHLCRDLLDDVGDDINGLAYLYVWLRFSALRQLDWQRRYNTKPRELSHAQDRLTQALAALYARSPTARPLVRLMLTTLGRGGDGQRIRDEILEIMHRHKIKEVSGHFTEEWHQKLHNNTTADDIAICEAYLAFLHSDGDLGLFYDELKRRGVTRDRLRSYDRPIKTDPDFVAHLKQGLLRDFGHFLQTLKAVHEGTDLGTARDAAGKLLDSASAAALDALWTERNEPTSPVLDLLSHITTVRRGIAKLTSAGRDGLRDLLFLDLALEDFLRVVVERNIHLDLDLRQLTSITSLVLENLLTTGAPQQELSLCWRHWRRIIETTTVSTQDWALLAHSALERIRRVVGESVDETYQLLQPKAEHLGKALAADQWTITLFSEEVVRGRPPFMLSLLLRRLEPLLRSAAQLGDWQVISRGSGSGVIKVVGELAKIQGHDFGYPTVVVADRVSGDEEIPEGVTAVITPDTPDLVSHVAVRARNAHLLFATCHGSELLSQLKAKVGEALSLTVSASGDVLFESAAHAPTVDDRPTTARQLAVRHAAFSAYAIGIDEFDEQRVGGKANHLCSLRNSLAEWIHVPTAAALPFGVFEQVLRHPQNAQIAQQYGELAGQAESLSGTELSRVLSVLRDSVTALRPPPELLAAVGEVVRRAGMSWPEETSDSWRRITSVWASKWNDRAFWSRRAAGIPHANLQMAVLIQPIAPAEYAFVIHTVNPFSNNPSEIYAEVVVGLGETLVGNYPGRALGFVCDKRADNTGVPRVLHYPSKGVALHGEGLIFRSDSNGEDLARYAGAGLYDSLPLRPATSSLVDYAEEPLIWDSLFRQRLLTDIANVGATLEAVFGSPQDIEGTYGQNAYHVVQTRPQVGV